MKEFYSGLCRKLALTSFAESTNRSSVSDYAKLPMCRRNVTEIICTFMVQKLALEQKHPKLPGTQHAAIYSCKDLPPSSFLSMTLRPRFPI